MSETTRLALPLLMPSQAQKHVTVNEALLRLDALSQLVLRSRTAASPPTAPSEGECYGVPGGAQGAWSGRSGQIAIYVGGGWDFVAPGRGWTAFIEGEGAFFVYDGGWVPLETGVAPPASGPTFRQIPLDHTVSAGAVSTTTPILPAQASVWGITGLVTDLIGGAPSFQIGVAGSADRYGSGIGTDEGSWLRGLTGSPLAYWEDTPIVLTAQEGSFDGTGTLRLLVYAAEFPLPT